MALIDADELRKNMEKHCEWCKRCLSLYTDLKGRCELCPMSQVFSWIDPMADQPTEEKTVIGNGDITPKEALDATARLVDRVLEILPNIMQSVIDAMPDAIEKYLEKEYGADNQIPCDTCKHLGENGAIDPTGEDYCPLDHLCNNASLYEKRGGDYEEAVQIHLEKRSDEERQAYMQGWKAGLESGKRQMLGQRAIKGRWIVNKDGDKICSHCKTGTSRETNASMPLFDFCPYCGSDNRE